MLNTLQNDTRGQTLNDFALGVSLFFVVLGFTFMFIPSVTAPFMQYGDEGMTLRSERAGNLLVNSELATSTDADATNTLDTTCTVAFFNGNDLADCTYDGESLPTLFSLRNGESAKVAITPLDSSTPVTIQGTTLERGGNPTSQDTPTSYSRIVTLDGDTYRLTVSVW